MKEYIGDSVYMEWCPHRQAFILTTENGLPNDPSNTIILEVDLLERLNRFAARIKESPDGL